MDVGQAITEGIRSTYRDDRFILGHPYTPTIGWTLEQVRELRAILRWGEKWQPVIRRAVRGQ